MIFKPTAIAGLWEIWPEMHPDERGFFARTACAEEFAAHGLPGDWAQGSISWNKTALTLRGLHYQAAPYGEHKLVRCTRGRIFDAAVDLRPNSPTLHQWHGLELSADNRAALYFSPGLAHGFLTLEDGCEVFYQIREPYRPEAGRGALWNDPAFGIAWPHQPRLLSERDANYGLVKIKPTSAIAG